MTAIAPTCIGLIIGTSPSSKNSSVKIKMFIEIITSRGLI
jgi:hypothetical protein